MFRGRSAFLRAAALVGHANNFLNKLFFPLRCICPINMELPAHLKEKVIVRFIVPCTLKILFAKAVFFILHRYPSFQIAEKDILGRFSLNQETRCTSIE